MGHSVTVGKSTATGVLPGHADTVALLQQGTVGENLGHAPVQWQGTTTHFAAVVVDLLHLALHHDSLGNVVHLFRHLLQQREINRGVTRRIPVMAKVRRPVDKQFFIGLGHQITGDVLAPVQPVAIFIEHRPRGFGGDQRFASERLCI